MSRACAPPHRTRRLSTRRETIKLVSGSCQVIDNALSFAPNAGVACGFEDLTEREGNEAEVHHDVGNQAKGTAVAVSRAPDAKRAFVVASDLLIWPLALAVAGYLLWYPYCALRVVYQQGRGRSFAKYLVFGFAYLVLGAVMLVITAVYSALTL